MIIQAKSEMPCYHAGGGKSDCEEGEIFLIPKRHEEDVSLGELSGDKPYSYSAIWIRKGIRVYLRNIFKIKEV